MIDRRNHHLPLRGIATISIFVASNTVNCVNYQTQVTRDQIELATRLRTQQSDACVPADFPMHGHIRKVTG